MNLSADPREITSFVFLADALPQLVWIAEPNGEVTYYNDRVKEFAGAEKLATGKWKWNGLVHPDDEEATVLAWTTAIAQGTTYEIEHRAQMKDGSYRWHLSRAIPQRNEVGQIINWFGTATDIHEQKIAEQKMLESEIQFRTLANSILQLAWIANDDGSVFWYNDRFFEYTGMTMEEIQKGVREKLHHPDHLQHVSSFFETAWKKGEPWELTFPLKGKDEKYRWFLTRAVPIKNANGKVYRWIGTNTDIDEQINWTEKLETLVMERTKELQRSNDDLQQFAHVASHDLKEPVRKIRTFMNRLSTEFKETLPERAQYYINKVEGASERMYSMIDGVLLYATVNETELIIEPVDLNLVFQNIMNDLELVIQNKNAAIQFSKLPSIQGMPLLIYQLFYNLINNALKFSKKDTSPLIQITSKTTPQTIEIIVQDNGIGFSNDQKQNIFKPFSRLNSKEEYEGTGLGLSLCQKIVERHKGTIEAEGEKGVGATFRIIFPR